MCGRKLGKACLKELIWGRRGEGGGGLDWTGPDWIGLDWIDARCEMQDARCGQCGKRSGWDEGSRSPLNGLLE